MNTTKILRHINAIRCLRLLHDGRALSRADIARELGLTRTTIGYAVNELSGAGYVLEGEMLAGESRGRPGIAVSLNPSGAYFVGVDIGPGTLTAVVVDLRMNVVSRIVEPTGPRFRDPDNILERILVLVRRVSSEAAVTANMIEGLCVSVPGLVARDGSVVNAPFLERRNYPLRDRLKGRVDDDWIVVVLNDATAFASAEASSLSPVNGGSVLLVLMAEGIGGAIIDGGRPISGKHGYSGEIGHTVITAGGRTNTFELLTGARSFGDLLDPDKTVAEGVEGMLASADKPAVRAALEHWSEVLATGFANTVHLLDPGRIVIGGPLAALIPACAELIETKLSERLLPGFEAPSISVARYGADGAAIGAAATIRESIFSLPQLD